MKYDLSKLTEEDIDYLVEMSRFYHKSITEVAGPYGGSCPIDQASARMYYNKTYNLGCYIDKLITKIKKCEIKKTIITAQEAREYTKQNVKIILVNENPLSEALISNFMKRIKHAIEDGRTHISTGGVSSDGRDVRGIGNYLHPSILDNVVVYFTGLGYTVEPCVGSVEHVYTISWAEAKPQLPKPDYISEDTK